ncbi:MAG TPA: HAD-IIA family hydrolase [Anaerolineae bacterium]|nr:HAD-IIA family hydrolase [Anaerolineae bacterium]
MARVTQWYEAYIFDLDGTVYLGDELLPEAGETIQALRDKGKRTLFLSNNPTRPRAAYAQKLTKLGLPTPDSDVINSSYVMVHFLQQRMPGANLFVVGETSLKDELIAAGFHLTDEAEAVEAVIASFDRTFDYHKLQVSFDAINAGARFFATNGDRYCPVPGGGEPDAAAMIAAIEACTDTKVEAIVGKPSHYTAETILHLAGVPAEQCVMTGDRWETDVLLGLRAGMAGALTLTGATSLADMEDVEVEPTYIINHLGELLPDYE